MTENRRPETIAAGNGMGRDTSYGAVAPPLYLASSYTFERFGRPREREYSRTSNPTRDQLADTLAKLEGARRPSSSRPAWPPLIWSCRGFGRATVCWPRTTAIAELRDC